MFSRCGDVVVCRQLLEPKTALGHSRPRVSRGLEIRATFLLGGPDGGLAASTGTEDEAGSTTGTPMPGTNPGIVDSRGVEGAGWAAPGPVGAVEGPVGAVAVVGDFCFSAAACLASSAFFFFRLSARFTFFGLRCR